jgi:hypothetical protein
LVSVERRDYREAPAGVSVTFRSAEGCDVEGYIGGVKVLGADVSIDRTVQIDFDGPRAVAALLDDLKSLVKELSAWVTK